MLMKPEELAEHHQTLSSQVGSGHETILTMEHEGDLIPVDREIFAVNFPIYGISMR